MNGWSPSATILITNLNRRQRHRQSAPAVFSGERAAVFFYTPHSLVFETITVRRFVRLRRSVLADAGHGGILCPRRLCGGDGKQMATSEIQDEGELGVSNS